MSNLVDILLIGLALKVLWNVLVPYHLLRLGDQSRGVDVLAFAIEWILLAASLIIRCAGGKSFVPVRTVIMIGPAAIVASYAHFVVVAFVGGWLRARARRRNVG